MDPLTMLITHYFVGKNSVRIQGISHKTNAKFEYSFDGRITINYLVNSKGKWIQHQGEPFKIFPGSIMTNKSIAVETKEYGILHKILLTFNNKAVEIHVDS